VTYKVSRGDIVQVVSATGTLNPVILSPVGAQVSGIVWKIHADYNSPVKKGQPLVELDPALFLSAVTREEANVAAAKAAVLKARADAANASIAAKRARALVSQHYIALADRDTAVAQEASTLAALAGAEAGVKQAQANLEKVKLDLKNSIVLSPVDGTVIARNVELGQAVVASFQAPNLFTIAEDLKKMQVLANVDEADIGYVRPGAVAQFTVDSYRTRRFFAKVAQVRNSPQTVQNVVTYVVVLDVDNSELLLKPGMTANVRLEVARRSNALLIPSAALRFKPRLDRGGEKGGDSGQAPGAGGRRWRDRDDDKAGGQAQTKPEAKAEDDKAGNQPDGGVPEGGSGGATDGSKPDGGKRPGRREGGSRDRGTRATVWLPDGDSAKAAVITPGITDGNYTEVVSGLDEGQVIIVDTARSATGAPPATNAFAPPGAPRPGGGGMRRGGF
jgi:HlyD family secretion protein